MRFMNNTRLLLFAVLFGFGHAQTSSASAEQVGQFISALPACALPCLTNAIQESPCSLADIACQCTNTELITSAEVCVAQSCSVVDSLVAKNLTQTQCGAPVRDKTVEYNIISCTLFSVALAIVIVRILNNKFFTIKGLGLDDCFIILTLVNCIPSAFINVTILTHNGLGRDTWTLTPEEITRFAKGFWVITIMYFSEVFVLKLALLFFYLRIFPGPTIRRLLWGTVVFNVLFGLAFILTAILQCQPISYNWTNWRGEGGGTCANVNAIAWANACVSIALDIWMLALPLSQLSELKLHWKKKVGVALMFCVGTFVTVVSVVRLTSLVEFRESRNLTWDYWNVSMWSTVEITVGIICACMPSLRSILIRVAPKIFDGTAARRTTQYYAKKMGSADKSSAQASQNEASGNRKSLRFSLRPSNRNSRFTAKSPADIVVVDGVSFSRATPSPRTPGFDESSEAISLVPLEHTARRLFGTSTTISSMGTATRASTSHHDRDTPSPV
ncbi:CFEM domain-containing protein [Xylariaceae sp. FL0016]|nr:CFEM domain-containing protein [Xylariaceae sp. FL0016]